MLLTWNVIDRNGRRIGRVCERGYGRAFVVARDKFGDRFSAVTVHRPAGAPKVKPTPAMLAGGRDTGREFPSWDAGR